MAERNQSNTTDYAHPQESNLLNIHKALQYNTDGEPELRVTNSMTLTSAPWYLQVARGQVTGVSVVVRSGYNPDIDGATEESIWYEGGIYPHGTWTLAQHLHVISTSDSDTGQSIYIEGLDASYNIQTETVVTNGTTEVATTKNYIRILTATIISASANSANAGNITFRLNNGTGTVVAHIGPGLGITKLSQYTVPAGYTGYILYGDCTSFHTGTGNISSMLKMMVRPYGGAFVAAYMTQVINGNYRNEFQVPLAIPEKADVDVRVSSDGNNTTVTASWEIVLIQNGL